MIDLHLHFEGSIPKEDLTRLASNAGLDLPSDFPNNKEFIVLLLQNKSNIEFASYKIIKKAYELGLYYLEIRLDPILFTMGGLKPEEVLNSFLKGMYRGLDEDTDINANVILCCNKEYSFDVNSKIIELANDYHQDNNVVGIDFEGTNKNFKLEDYKNLLLDSKRNGLHLAYHALKDTSVYEIKEAINIGFERIAGGLNCKFDNSEIQFFNEHNIAFDFCLTTNLKYGLVKDIKSHPFTSLLRKGLRCTVNSDNGTYFDTDVNKEFKLLVKECGLIKNDILRALSNSISASFASIKEKADLYLKVNNAIDWYWERKIN